MATIHDIRPGGRNDNDGEPPDNGGMETRVAALEAAVKTLATREDLNVKVADLRVEIHRAINEQTWKLITWTTGLGAALVAAVYFIAHNVR